MRGNSYILDLKNLKPKDNELIGNKAIEKSLLRKEGFSTPSGFVLTSLAFDDFLISTNLVEPVSLLLDEVKPFIKETSVSVSEEIRSLILKAKIPKIIEIPLIEAYKNLSPVLEDSFISVKVSNVIDNKFVHNSVSNFRVENIKGLVQLVDAVKECWLTLFTPEALEFRVNEYYQGPLSIALTISRMPSGDVSGEYVSIDNSKGEIQSIYGIGDLEDKLHTADIYFVNLDTKVISDKHTARQEKITIRKGNSTNGKGMLIDIEISDEWKDKQKVPDRMINKLIDELAKFNKIIKKPFKLKWSIESGDIIFEDYSILEKHSEATDIAKLKSSKKTITKASKKNTLVGGNVDDIFLIDGFSSQDYDDEEVSLEDLENMEMMEFNSVIDITPLTSTRINAIKHFSRTYFDGTGIVQSLDNSLKPDQKISKLAVEISSAMRSSKGKNLLYSFSDIGYSTEIRGKVKFTGDERFIDSPEDLLVECVALLTAISSTGNQLEFILPSLRSFKNLKDLIRILNKHPEFSKQNKKIFAEVAIPSFLFELTKAAEIIDGFVVDYFKLIKLIVYRQNLRAVDHGVMFEVLDEILAVCQSKNLALFVKLDTYPLPIIDQIMGLEGVGIIFKSIPPKDVLDRIKAENSKLNFIL